MQKPRRRRMVRAGKNRMTFGDLPVQLTTFIGRERELAELQALVANSRLVTLTGVGGCGKTRLALQIANIVGRRYRDGTWFVDFVPVRDPDLVAQHVAEALGVRSAPDEHKSDQLARLLQSRQLLVVLDNCEHLAVPIARLVHTLLAAAPGVSFLATSRQPLGHPAEMIYQVHGLAAPSRDGASTSDLRQLMRFDAIHLFAERGRPIAPDFRIMPDNAPAIAEICRRLDGNPLALELASARLNILTPQQIAARLDDRFALLTSKPLGVANHHHTLRAALDWSHDLLRPQEQMLLRRLAVFDAGCTVDAAECVCSGGGIAGKDVLDLLSSLVDKSLVFAETTGRAEARYKLLETIREYAIGKLREAGELTRLRNRHLAFFVTRAEVIEPKLQGSPDQSLGLSWLHGEMDNVRAALGWALESGRIKLGLRMAVALFHYWASRGSMMEGRSWVERLLAGADQRVPSLLRGRAATYAGMMAGFLGDADAARAYERTAVALREAAGEESSQLLALAEAPRALAALIDGDFATAYAIVGDGVELFRRLGNDSELIMALGTQAMSATGMGNFQLARSLADEALSIARRVGDPYRTALVLACLGRLEYCEENYVRAQSNFEQALASLRALGTMREEPFAVQGLAYTRLRQRDFAGAHSLFLECVALFKSRGQADPKAMAECLMGFGALASERGMPAEATCLLTAAVTLGGSIFMSLLRAQGMEYETYMASARAHLTEEEFAQAQLEGRSLTLGQAVDFALSLPLMPSEATATSSPHKDGLTRRERQVADLIGQGKMNGEIAAELVLSKRTVEKHIANILAKLRLTNRAQIVRWALAHHLSDT